MKIKDCILSKSYTGFYFDDQKAIKEGAKHDGFIYIGKPKTIGFPNIRMPGEAISIQLILEDGSYALGDCCAVQYSGAGGRDPLFLADDFIPFINEHLLPLIIGEDVDLFKPLAEKYDRIEINGHRLHTAIRYGLTQAFLNATACANKMTKAEVIRKEYHLKNLNWDKVAIFAQSGDDRYLNVDKMIIKEVDVLPHALINNIDKLGGHGEKLIEYIIWLRNRVLKLRTNENYNPVLHIDTYGTIGIAFGNDLTKIFKYFQILSEAAKPFKLRIEGPIDTGSRKDTMEALRDLRKLVDNNNLEIEIVADEWCNTLDDIKYFADNNAGHMLQIKTPDLGGVNNIVEAIIYCNQKHIGAYCGGTCNETDISAQVTTSIALACHASQCLAKPGMGYDEGYMIVKNEMNRTIALANRRGL